MARCEVNPATTIPKLHVHRTYSHKCSEVSDSTQEVSGF